MVVVDEPGDKMFTDKEAQIQITILIVKTTPSSLSSSGYGEYKGIDLTNRQRRAMKSSRLTNKVTLLNFSENHTSGIIISLGIPA